MTATTDLLLHVGPDKTGTTSIQKFCHRFRNLLRQHGIEYPDLLGDPNHRWLTAAFLSDWTKLPVLKSRTEPDIRHNTTAAKRIVHRAASRRDHKLVVLSHEGVHALSYDDLVDLSRFLLQFKRRITILYYVRHPLEYAKSAMSQRVLTARSPTEPDMPVQNHKFIISRYISVFGREAMTIRWYGPSILQDFLRYLGVVTPEAMRLAASNSHNNSALTAPAIEVGVRLREQLSAAGIQPLSFKDAFGHKLRAITGPPITLTEQQVDDIRTQTQESLDFLRAEFGINFSWPSYNPRKSAASYPNTEDLATSLLKGYQASTRG